MSPSPWTHPSWKKGPGRSPSLAGLPPNIQLTGCESQDYVGLSSTIVTSFYLLHKLRNGSIAQLTIKEKHAGHLALLGQVVLDVQDLPSHTAKRGDTVRVFGIRSSWGCNPWATGWQNGSGHL